MSDEFAPAWLTEQFKDIRGREARKRVFDNIERIRTDHNKFGYNAQHDDEHVNGELMAAALTEMALAIDLSAPDYNIDKANQKVEALWPFDDHRPLLPTVGGEEISISFAYHAAAVLIAELERIERKNMKA